MKIMGAEDFLPKWDEAALESEDELEVDLSTKANVIFAALGGSEWQLSRPCS